MVFDPPKPSISNSYFERKDWSCSGFSSTIKKTFELRPNSPAPGEVRLVIVSKVDVDHARSAVARGLRAGLTLCLNSVKGCWCSKKQNIVETSSFVRESITMKKSFECSKGVAFELRMMGISCEGPACAHGDDQSTLASAIMTEHALKKKPASLAIHP